MAAVCPGPLMLSAGMIAKGEQLHEEKTIKTHNFLNPPYMGWVSTDAGATGIVMVMEVVDTVSGRVRLLELKIHTSNVTTPVSVTSPQLMPRPCPGHWCCSRQRRWRRNSIKYQLDLGPPSHVSPVVAPGHGGCPVLCLWWPKTPKVAC